MKEKILTKDFCCAFSALFFCSMVMYMLVTTLTEYAVGLGAGASLGGAVSGIYVVGGMFSRLCSGRALTKLGWKRFAAVALTLHFAACLGYFAADGLAALIAVRFLHGLGFGGGATAIITMGMSILPQSRYGEAAGYFMLAPTLAIAAGPYGGGLIYDAFGATGCFAAASFMSLVTLLSAAAINLRGAGAPQKDGAEERDGGGRGLRRFIEPGAVPVSFCILLLAFGYVPVMSFYRLYAEETGLVSEFSYFFLIYGAALLICRPAAGRIQDSVGDNLVCLAGAAAQAVGLSAIALSPGPLSVVVCAVGCALGYGTLNSCCNVIAYRSAAPERRSYAMATYWIFCDGGMGIGPAVFGAVKGAAGFSAMYCAAAAVSLAALPAYWLAWGCRHRTLQRRGG